MKIISICGVDGSGKTTLVKNIVHSSLPVTTLRCPQYYESGKHEMDSLARTFEEWSQECDRLQNPPLKALVLFLQISLFGVMEQDQMKFAPQARILLRERDPVIDTLVYAPLYLHFLGSNQPVFPLEWIQNEQVKNYVKSLNETLLFVGGELTLERLREYVLAFFGRPTQELAKNCLILFKSTLPSEVVILKMDEKLLNARLQLKHESRGGVKEYHEESGLLQKLQAGLEFAAQQGAQAFGFKVHVVDLNLENQNQVLQNFEQLIQQAL